MGGLWHDDCSCLSLMWLTVIMSLSCSQVADAGAWPVSRTIEVTELVPRRGDAVAITFQTVVFTSEEQERAFTTATLRLRDGRVTPVLAALNAKLAALPDLDEAQRAMGAGDFSGDTGRSIEVVVNQRPWLDLRVCGEVVGTYPWSDCRHERLNVETGEPWAWTDAIAPARLEAFLDGCSKRLAAASREKEDEWLAAGSDLEVERMYGFLPSTCTSAMFDDAELDEDERSLTVWVGRGVMHVTEPMAWPLIISRVELRKWVDPRGPLGHLAQKE